MSRSRGNLCVGLQDQAVTGAALIAAGALQVVRLGRWAGERTWRKRLVLILHIGYVRLRAARLRSRGLGLPRAGTVWSRNSCLDRWRDGCEDTGRDVPGEPRSYGKGSCSEHDDARALLASRYRGSCADLRGTPSKLERCPAAHGSWRLGRSIRGLFPGVLDGFHTYAGSNLVSQGMHRRPQAQGQHRRLFRSSGLALSKQS
jgi:hypothetical protein